MCTKMVQWGEGGAEQWAVNQLGAPLTEEKAEEEEEQEEECGAAAPSVGGKQSVNSRLPSVS